MAKRSGVVSPLHSTRVRMRRELELAVSYWADCDDADREEMRQELIQLLTQIELDLQTSNLDHLAEMEITARIAALRQHLF